MKWLLTISSCIIFLTTTAEVSDPAGVMLEGNAAYETEDYMGAIASYKQVAESHSSPSLFLNMGNAYYRMDSIALAILYYERALKLDPGNEAADMNLQIANQRTLDDVPLSEQTKLSRWWMDLTGNGNWPLISILLSIVGFACLCYYLITQVIMRKRIFFYSGVVIILLGFVSYMLASSHDARLDAANEAIILEGEVGAYSTPSEHAELSFVLHAGTKVSVTQEREDWIEISLENGLIGWVPAATLEVI